MATLGAQPVNPPVQENGTEEGLRIVSFDGGGPGSYSQLLMLKEVIRRMKWDKQSQGGDEEFDFDEDELCPADYFDMMGGVGFGAYCALMLGHLHLTIGQALDELSSLADDMFPNTPNEISTPDANSARLKDVVEGMLRRNGFPVDMLLKGKMGESRQCKVVIFIQATSTPGNCTPFRTYLTRSAQGPKCTFVEAACAALSNPPDFSPVAIGMTRVKTLYSGIPLGFNNPARKALDEALVAFGKQKPVSLILSLGAGKQSSSSIHFNASMDGNRATLLTRIVMDSERVDDELILQLTGVDLYLRLDVDRGLEDMKTSDWHQLGVIGAHTQSYLENGSTAMDIDKALRSLRDKEHLTFAQLNGAARQAVSRVPTELLNDMRKEVKDMRDIVVGGLKEITIIDAIGNRTSIPLQYCVTYEMLQDMVKFYFKHQKAPGSTFVNKGEYKLAYGKDRRTVKPSEWMYLQAPNLELEMSMVVRKKGDHIVRCPKCNTEFHGKGRNGWAICPNQLCKMRYQYQAKPPKFRSPSSNKELGYSRDVAKDNRSSMSQEETTESVDRFRLLSVVHQNEIIYSMKVPKKYKPYYKAGVKASMNYKKVQMDVPKEVNTQMNVPEDEISDHISDESSGDPGDELGD